MLALTMPGSSTTSRGVELVGEDADAVLLGGADEASETNQVFSYYEPRARLRRAATRRRALLPAPNRWWQTSRGPLLDAGAFVAGLEYAAGRRGDRARQAERRLLRGRARRARRRAGATWMVGDDIEADVAGAKGVGLRDRPGADRQVPEEALEESRRSSPTA